MRFYFSRYYKFVSSTENYFVMPCKLTRGRNSFWAWQWIWVAAFGPHWGMPLFSMIYSSMLVFSMHVRDPSMLPQPSFRCFNLFIVLISGHICGNLLFKFFLVETSLSLHHFAPFLLTNGFFFFFPLVNLCHNLCSLEFLFLNSSRKF